MNELHSHSVTGHIRPRDTRWPIYLEEAAPREEYACMLERNGYSVRVADSASQRSKASMLVERMYAWRGYHTESVASFPSPSRLMLVASTARRELFGTLTLGLDSEEGLLADTLYQEEANNFRRMGCRLCEMSKLAVDPQYGSKEVLASLIHLAYIYVHIIHNATDVLIEVHPRHAGFYERRLGFHQIAEMRTCPRVNAPAVLLHIELAYMQEQISQHAGSRDPHEKSLYPYFLSTCEQQAPTNRIQLAA